MDHNTIDAVIGGALADKTPSEASDLISTMAKNCQNFWSRTTDMDRPITKVGKWTSFSIVITSLVSQLEKGANHQVMLCGVHGLFGHYQIDNCLEIKK